MDKLLTAIVDDDHERVGALLKRDASLATRHITKPRLYRSGIFHWIYANDTALHLAAAGYRLEIARLLLAAGADPNASANHRRSSPLHYAADGYITGPAWDPEKQVEMIRYLLQQGAKINAADKNGATPLHRAVRTRCASAVQFLLKAGSDPTLKNKPGSTPFHLAVQNTGRGGSGADAAIAAQKKIIEEFLSLGISPKIKNDSGKSVLDSAQSAWIRELLSETK
jgi:ankyrin repeat protein